VRTAHALITRARRPGARSLHLFRLLCFVQHGGSLLLRLIVMGPTPNPDPQNTCNPTPNPNPLPQPQP